MLMPNTVSSGVCAYRLLSTTSATSPRFSSMTTRMPSLSDSSRSSEMPSISLSRTSSAMRSSRRALFTWYGSSVTMMAWRPPPCRCLRNACARGSTGGRGRCDRRWRFPCAPLMMPAVGKSGPGMCCISSASVTSGSSSSARQALTTSVRLCGGMLVAMPTAMPVGAIDQQVREARRQHRRLGLRSRRSSATKSTVSLSMSASSSLRDARHAHFGVTHGGRRIAVHRAEVALAVDEHVAHRERLRHAHHRVVHRGVAVRVVLADDVADDARGFLVGLVPVVAELAHGVQHAAMHGLQAVAHVGQRAARRSRSSRSRDTTAASRLRD